MPNGKPHRDGGSRNARDHPAPSGQERRDHVRTCIARLAAHLTPAAEQSASAMIITGGLRRSHRRRHTRFPEGYNLTPRDASDAPNFLYSCLLNAKPIIAAVDGASIGRGTV